MKKNINRMITPVFVNLNVCDGCGLCAEICPSQVFEMKKITVKEIKTLSFFGRLKVRIKGNVKSYVATPDECISCSKCASSCHEHAITLNGLKISA